MNEFGRDCTRDANTHRGVSVADQNRSRLIRREQSGYPVLVLTHVRDQNVVPSQRGTNLMQNPSRLHRIRHIVTPILNFLQNLSPDRLIIISSSCFQIACQELERLANLANELDTRLIARVYFRRRTVNMENLPICSRVPRPWRIFDKIVTYCHDKICLVECDRRWSLAVDSDGVER